MTTKQIQYSLLALGYNPGVVDGIMGGNTRNAVVQFQKDASIDVDGVPGKQTQEAMCKWLLDGKTRPETVPSGTSTTNVQSTILHTSNGSSSFTPRLSKPEARNPFYNTRSNGGYSTCIVGKPTDSGCNVLSNCVGYAMGRFNEIIGSWKYSISGNAEDFWRNKGSLQGGDIPKIGSIICWKKGMVGNSADGAGHVAIVEKVNPDGSIITSESGWNSSAFWTKTRYKGNGNWGATGYDFLGFIYNPGVK